MITTTPVTTTSAVTTPVITTTPVTTTPVITTTTISSVTTSEITTTVPEPVVYTVNFYDDNNNLVYSESVEENGTISAIPSIPEKIGYTGKWVYNGSEYTGGTVVSDMTITAVYTIKTYTVTYEADCDNAADIPSAETYEYGKTVTLPAVPEKTGYTGEWDYDGSIVTGNITITAVYTIKTYTVTYEADCDNAADIPSAETYEYGKTVTLPAVPEKTGYTGEWDYDGSPVTGNITITAVYTIKTYTVTLNYDVYGSASETYKHGDTFEIPEIPDKKYYTGVWVCNGTEFEVYQTVTVTGNMEFNIEYTPITIYIDVNIPNYSYGSPPGTYDVIPITYGKLFSQNDRGFTVDYMLQLYDDPTEAFPDEWWTETGWDNYTADHITISGSDILTDDTLIDDNYMSEGTDENGDLRYFVYIEVV